MSDSPDRIVANRIARQFHEKGIITEEGVEEFTKKLSDGEISTEDWKLMTNLTTEGVEESKDAQAD